MAEGQTLHTFKVLRAVVEEHPRPCGVLNVLAVQFLTHRNLLLHLWKRQRRLRYILP